MSSREARTHKKTRFLWRALFSRFLILVICILIQIHFLWAVYSFLNDKFAYGFFVALSALELMVILNQEGSSAFKIAWIVPILVFPVFGGLLYLFIKLQGTVKKMRRHLDREAIRSGSEMIQSPEVTAHIAESESKELHSVSMYLNGYCGYPTYDDTEVRYYGSGEEFFPVFYEELEKAKDFIFMEYFIVSIGEVWERVYGILKKKAKEGVEIKFMYDGTNAIQNLPFKYAKELKKEGIDAKIFSPIVPALASYQNNRDHRKICVIDGHTAFTGGVNIADEYANITSRFGYWKDSAAMFKGSAANTFTMMFLQMWNTTHPLLDRKVTDVLPYRRYCYELASKKDKGRGSDERKGFVIPYGDSPLDSETIGENIYAFILNTAREYVYIKTPYLILDDRLMSALCFAAKRGVDVRIMFPEIPDKAYAYWLGHAYFKELILSGVRIFKFKPGFVHSKEFICDGKLGVIGSINLDFRSLYLHFENAVFMYDVLAVKDMEKDFRKNLRDCVEIDMEAYEELPPLKLFFGKALRVFAPLF